MDDITFSELEEFIRDKARRRVRKLLTHVLDLTQRYGLDSYDIEEQRETTSKLLAAIETRYADVEYNFEGKVKSGKIKPYISPVPALMATKDDVLSHTIQTMEPYET